MASGHFGLGYLLSMAGVVAFGAVVPVVPTGAAVSVGAWVSSPAFAHGHRSAAERAGGDAPKPVGVHSEQWNYEIAVTNES